MLTILFIDQISKYWAIHAGYMPGTILTFKSQLNFGIMTGVFRDIDPLFRVVTLSIVGTFLVILYFFLIYLYEKEDLFFLNFGSATYMGSILSNLIDRTVRGGVVDFVHINLPGIRELIFNFADVTMLLGFIALIYTLFKDYEKIFFQGNKRKFLLINKHFQYHWIFICIGIVLFLAVILGLFCFSYIKVILDHDFHTLKIFFSFFVIITLLYSGIIFIFLLILSHRIAGPIYAFQQYIKRLEANPDEIFKLRSNDYFQELEIMGRDIKSLKKDNLND
jgi:signal peptidase II